MTEKFRNRNTKIVATMGPSSSDYETIKALFIAGVDVFRLNFSHSTHEDHQARYDIIRQVQAELGQTAAVLADLQGPKIRLGVFAETTIAVSPGHRIVFDLIDEPGTTERVKLPHPEVIAALKVGERVLVDDGKVQLAVVEKHSESLVMEVLTGRKLSDRKGVNIPDTLLATSPLTEKDRRDLPFALDMGADWVALSFVQTPEDVREAKALIGGRATIISKIEKPSAVKNLAEIIDESDGVMLARGDLGVEIPAAEVPVVQKDIVRLARDAGKPLIVATQMLESMIDTPTPTRAEASDVATAIYDGADAVMLSAETAAGQYPLEAVRIMDHVARTVETSSRYRKIMDAEHPAPTQGNTAQAITAAAFNVATIVEAAAIVTFTTSGSTTLRTARERPGIPTLCLTTDKVVAQRLNLSYGVTAVAIEDEHSRFSKIVEVAVQVAKAKGLAVSGDKLVVTAGVPFGEAGTTNSLRVVTVD